MTDRTDELIERMEKGFDRITARLDQINGRTGKNEQAIAVLQDRSDRGGLLGAIAGGSVGGVILAVKAWFDR